MSHQHYDEAQDRRWTCHRNPCLLHEVAPAPPAVSEPSPAALADVLAAAVLDGQLPPVELERMARAYFLARGLAVFAYRHGPESPR